jgi:hypothetical protein
VNGTLTLKIGVAGRVVAGPKGGADKMLLPLRIAVVKQAASKVLFSKLYKVPVSLAAPDFASDFSEVAENVTVQVAPDDHDLIILVGFDAGNKKR